MNKLYAVVIFSLSVIYFSSPIFAKDEISHINKAQILEDAAFEKMTQLSSPGEMQGLLSSLIGEWSYTVTVRTSVNAAPEQSMGRATNDMILNGRFLSMKSFAVLNINNHRMPFEGNGMIGYDNVKKIFTSVWMDTLNPGMMIGTGTYVKKSNIIKESGHFTSPINKAKANQTYRSELQFIDSQSFKRTIFIKDKTGKEFKTIEIEYRKK